MSMNVDQALGIHADALMVRSRRAAVLASNLANSDTPGFKARDIDFKQVLDEARDGVRMRATHERHAGAAEHGSIARGAQLKYRYPNQPAVDGNTVDAHVEKGEFMRNSVLYSASLSFLNSRISGLLNALRAGQ